MTRGQLLRIALRVGLVLYGLRLLHDTALEAFGGAEKLAFFTNNDAHRFTAKALLSGSLTLRNAVSQVWNDEEIFNGAVYTNWGYGIPLLQLPFHALAAHMKSTPQGFFPDRKIFFYYLTAAIALLWAGFDTALACAGLVRSPLRRHVFSWAATSLTLACAVYPLMATRFLMYEETVAYFVLIELVAVAAYVFTQTRARPVALGVLGVVAGLGLLTRPTGALYLAMWCVLVAIGRKEKRDVAIFSASAAPLVAFWLVTNWVKGGSPISTGFQNAMSWYPYHLRMLRFGSACPDNGRHLVETAERLFHGFFVSSGGEPTEWLKKCHFDFENRPVPSGAGDPHGPFFSGAVLVLLLFMLGHLVWTRQRRIAVYVPFAMLLLLFATYVVAGGGFAWRYAGDFWPAIVLACVQYATSLPRKALESVAGYSLAAGLAFVAHLTVERDVLPYLPTVETLTPAKASSLAATYQTMRTLRDPPFPSALQCANRPSSPHGNGLGWRADCSVDDMTSVYLGVTKHDDGDHELRFTTEGVAMDELRVLVNGRIYDARRTGSTFAAKVHIPYGRLDEPVVIATIEWSRHAEPPQGKLRSIELD